MPPGLPSETPTARNRTRLVPVVRDRPRTGSAALAVDLDGRVLAWSAAAEEMFGWRETDLIGFPLPMVVNEDWPELDTLLETARQGASVRDRAIRVRRQQERGAFAAHLASAPLRDLNGHITGMLAVVSADQPGPNRSDSSARMEAVGRLAGGVAHDFNNILTAIAGYASILAADLEADDPRQADVVEIQKATERATRLTRQLLAFGRRDAQQPRVLDLNAVLDDVLPMLRQLIGEHVDLVASAQSGLWPVLADPGQLEQVLVNLVLNARDAMPTGGRVVVRTANVLLDEPFVYSHTGARAGNHVLLAVEDSGVGMDHETLAHIFEPYFTTKDPGRGTGLGLSTVYGIVKQTSGYIWAESQLGRGSVVSVYLPRR